MLIGICGGICAGKSSVASYLIKEHEFKRVSLARTSSTPAVEKSASDASIPHERPPGDYYFSEVDELLNYVTMRWRERWVTTDVWDEDVLDVLSRRPWFLLVSVDAPISQRWERFKARCAVNSLTPPSLTTFVQRNDAHMYSLPSPMSALLARAQLRLLNSAATLSHLHLALSSLDLPNQSRCRPSWDHYFMSLASLAAQRSNCMKRQVGCVLVRDGRVLSTGYNGTPRGMLNCNEGGCERCNSGERAGSALDTCLCIHAETNALFMSGIDRIREGTVLYCNTCPCLQCSVNIVQLGIGEVVYDKSYSIDKHTQRILDEGGVKLRRFEPVQEGLVDLGRSIGDKSDIRLISGMGDLDLGPL